jgi:galactokinase
MFFSSNGSSKADDIDDGPSHKNNNSSSASSISTSNNNNNNNNNKKQSVADTINNRHQEMDDAHDELSREQEEKDRLAEDSELARRLDQWELQDTSKNSKEERDSNRKPLPGLLLTLHTVLWDGTTWSPLQFTDLGDSTAVNKWYKKAAIVVHPDKQRSAPAEQRFIAERVFQALTSAHSKFNKK